MTISESDINELLNNFRDAWNQGDLTKACDVYAEDASFIGCGGYVRGKETILDRYRNAYPDKSSMGVLAFELLESRSHEDIPSPMATAILRWTIRKPNDEEISGLAMEAYELRDNRILIIQDATLSS